MTGEFCSIIDAIAICLDHFVLVIEDGQLSPPFLHLPAHKQEKKDGVSLGSLRQFQFCGAHILLPFPAALAD